MVEALLLDSSLDRKHNFAADGIRSDLSVIAVTSELPWPLNTGGHLRSFYMLRALSKRFRTRVIVPVRPGQAEEVASLVREGFNVRAVEVNRRTVVGELRKVASAAFAGLPYVMYRRHVHSAIQKALSQEIDRVRPDVLYLDHIDSMAHWRGKPPGRIVLDLHNVYSVLLERTAQERGKLTRHFLQRESRLLGKVERIAAEQADALLCVSENDATHFRELGGRSVHIVPNGVDCATYATLAIGRKNVSPLVLFVGDMAWSPNVAAVRFLARHVLPQIRSRFAGARLRVVGRNPTAEIQALASMPGVEVSGTVVSVLPHLAEADVLAVPLQAGGGTRLKILEAFAAGLPVISTPVGCEGLEVVNKEHLLIADREHFATELISLLESPENGAFLAQNAKRLASAHYDWKTITTNACDVLQAVMH